MKTVIRLVPLAVAAMVLLAGVQDSFAQQSGGQFTERFANVFDPNSRTYYSLQATEGEQFGGQQPFTSFGASRYRGSIDNEVTLFNGQLLVNNNGNPAGTLGAQQRWLIDADPLDNSIIGAGIYLDLNHSRYDNLFQQINVNLEFMTESAWVVRANGYLPVGQIQQETGIGSSAGGPPGQLTLVGTQVGRVGIDRQLMDVGLMGMDLEFGRKLFHYRAEVYGGYYNWNGPLAGFTNGVKGGLRGYLTNNLSGNVNVSHDEFFGTNVYGGLTYFFGGSGGNQPMSFHNLMTLPVQRAQQVAIGNFVRETNTFQPLTDADTGDAIHLYFVAEAAAGAGTQNSPTNVNSVLTDPLFGAGSALVLLDANGNITSPIALTHDGQQILGGGSTGTADVDFSRALGEPPGTSVVHLSNLDGRPVLSPASGNAVTLTNQNTIQGFTIDGSGGLTNGIVGTPGAADTLIRDMLINNVVGIGITIQPSTNTTIDNVQFNGNGQDVQLNAHNTTITNVVSHNAVNGAIALGTGGGDISGVTLIENVTITGAGGFGGLFLENAQSGATINVNNLVVQDGAGKGLTIVASQAGSIYNLTNIDILNVGDNGMAIDSAAGTVHSTNLNINNTLNNGLYVLGSPNGIFNFSNLNISTTGASSVDNGILLDNAGTVTIVGGTVDISTGDGIHSVDTNLTATGLTIGAAGLISGDGVEVVNNGGAHAVNLSHNQITGSASGISTRDSGVPGELTLVLDGNTLQSLNAGSLALSVLGGGPNSTIIRSLSGGTVIGNGTGGGVLFNQVTFDASGTALNGVLVNAGDWTIGQGIGAAQRVQGDGLSFLAPTGNVSFGTLNAYNNNGTGLEVDTKSVGTTFTLVNGGGTIDTTNGTALFLDPLFGNLTFDNVASTNATVLGDTSLPASGNGAGVYVEGLTASGGEGTNALSINLLSVTNSAADGMAVFNSVGQLHLGTTTINTTGGAGINVFHLTGDLTASGTTTIKNTADDGLAVGVTHNVSLADVNIDTVGGVGLQRLGHGINVQRLNGDLTITGTTTIRNTARDGLNVSNAHNILLSDVNLENTDGITAFHLNGDLTVTGTITGDGLAVHNAHNVSLAGVEGGIFVLGLSGDLTATGPITGQSLNVRNVHNISLVDVSISSFNNHGIELELTGDLTISGTTTVKNGGVFSSGLNVRGARNVLILGDVCIESDVGTSQGVSVGLSGDLTVTGTITTKNATFGVGVSGGRNVSLAEINIDNAGHYGLFVGRLSGDLTVTGTTTMTNSSPFDHFLRGIIVNGAHNVSFADVTISNAIDSGMQVENVTGHVGVTGTTTITTTKSRDLIENIPTVGIYLLNNGSASFVAGTIDGFGNGIYSSNTNLTATGLTIGGTGPISGDGVIIVNNGSPHTVNLSHNSITANGSAISTTDSGNAGELLLTLDGNTLQTLNSGSPALSVTGTGLNSTIIQSMNGGTVIGNGSGGGVDFNRVTFDASGTALSGAPVTAGNWTIGTPANRVQGDGLRFDGPMGNLNFGTLNVSSNNGVGLLMDNSTGNISIAGGSIDGISGDGIRLNNVSSFTLNNTSVENTSGFTLNSTSSGLSGSGNTATTFSGNDGGGNTGSISFNGGANVFP